MRRSHSCCRTRLDSTSEPCALVISTPYRLTWVGLQQREFGSRKQALRLWASRSHSPKSLVGQQRKQQYATTKGEDAAAKFLFKKRCAVCKLQVSFYCASCSNDTREHGDDIVALCGPLSKNTFFSDYHIQKWREYDHECVCLFISINSWVEQISICEVWTRAYCGAHPHDTRADIKTHKHTYRSLTRC